MQRDLNEQFQRAQAVTTDEGMPRWIIALIVGLILSLGLIIIMGTVFVVKMLDKMVSPITDGESSAYTEEYEEYEDSPIDFFGTSNSGESTDKTTKRNQSTSDITANFKYGTVSGTSYYSEFSGISFKAPAGWSVNSYSGNNYSSLLSPRDMSASSSDMTKTVSISYSIMNSRLSNDIRDALDSQIRVATKGANNSMVDDDVSATLGGNQFTGILYKKDTGYYTYYIQVMVAEVNGYALEIYMEANSQAELNEILKMFK